MILAIFMLLVFQKTPMALLDFIYFPVVEVGAVYAPDYTVRSVPMYMELLDDQR